MPVDISHKLVIAITSRTLFDLQKSNDIFEEQGVSDYAKHQIKYEDKILRPGVAFPLVKKLLKLNKTHDFVEVVLISRNSADTGLRIMNSIEHYELDITRAAFTGGHDPYQYIGAFGAHLFLSANSDDVGMAIEANYAAATLIPQTGTDPKNNDIKIAFDGDAVIFSDESEQIFQEHGLEAFVSNEKQTANSPLAAGPFHRFLDALSTLQAAFDPADCPIRTALVTARQAPAHERVIKTLRSWNIRIDEALFLGGLSKGEFLSAFNADIFFDDQEGHCASATENKITAGHVPHGIKNK
jgi:5'-nucleotidase